MFIKVFTDDQVDEINKCLEENIVLEQGIHFRNEGKIYLVLTKREAALDEDDKILMVRALILDEEKQKLQNEIELEKWRNKRGDKNAYAKDKMNIDNACIKYTEFIKENKQNIFIYNQTIQRIAEGKPVSDLDELQE